MMKYIYKDIESLFKNQFESVPFITHINIKDRSSNGFCADIIGKESAQSVHVVVLERAFPQNINHLINQEKVSSDYLIVMAPYISETSASILEENKCGYIDYSGNCLIATNSIYISSKGNPNKYPRHDSTENLFRVTSHTTSLILRVLLADTSKKWKVQELSQTVGCSIGMASKVKTYLCEQEWAEMTRDGLQIIDPSGLLESWSAAYSLPESINCYTLDPLPVFESKCYAAYTNSNISCALSGLSGGVRYTPVVRYTKAHVWIRQKNISDFLDVTGCKIVDSGSNISLLIAPGDELFYDSRIINNSRVVSPVQAFLDCRQIKGRGEEMAEAIYQKEIRK